jgi:hypothetical protein
MMNFIFRIILFFFTIQFCFCQEKMNGLSFVASNSIPKYEEIVTVKNSGANWVALMPFAFLKSEKDTVLIYNSKNQWLGERVEGVEKTIQLFKKSAIKIMIKPQIWIPNGGFTGSINYRSEAEWLAFERQYERFIMTYVSLAITNKVELFCIGTELKFFAQKRALFFRNLIKKIRKVYKGKLTYAENWDCYSQIGFWNKLDFIGIDAYFELDDSKTPQVENLLKKWDVIKRAIKLVSIKSKRPVLFTEYGYQSKDFTTQKPYQFSDKSIVNLQAQSNALEAIFKAFWHEKWFAGGFNWKWYDNHALSRETFDTDYTVQNKPAENILKKYYKNKINP